MRCTEKEIGIMDEYEALRMELEEIEEARQRRGLTLVERNALEFLMERASEDLADSRLEAIR
jgi:hypothetical protein